MPSQVNPLPRVAAAADDPQWYKDAVIYQLHVRSFFDSTNSGVGDFRGLTQKLDYLQDLGVTAIWLLPFYPSPLRDDGYDIADYTSVNPAYGNLDDFKMFVNEAHRRGLRVITELVINHTSDQHPWFQRARRAKSGTPERDFYVWSSSPEKYSEARIIFKDYEPSNWAWDPLSKEYYWHRFFSHQPDLNFDNPLVQKTVLELLDFWMNLGVDGLRLDAIPYLFEREGTNCENLPETHAFLKAMRSHVDKHYPGRMLLAEANQWPEDSISYFGDGDECHTAFHFPVMPRLYMALHMEDRFPILDILQQTPAIPKSCQWVIFLRNHDELTLEMVTDEERDYMYRAYAHDRQARINLGIRRRLAPLLGNNRARIQLMNGLLFSLPGTPVIYYGDEIGMGDNIYLGDRHGVRTPMQWSPDRNAGFSDANSQRLFSQVISDGEYSYTTVNVELQQKNPHSLLWWMKRLIAIRQNYPAFGRGDFRPTMSNNPKVLSFTRHYQGQTMLVVANLSRFTQFVELQLGEFAPCRPVEVFGKTRLPQVTAAPYPLTLAPHVFHWFLLECDPSPTQIAADPQRFSVGMDGLELFRGSQKSSFETILARQIPEKPWFLDQSRFVTAVRIEDIIPLASSDVSSNFILLILRVEFRHGEANMYQLLTRVAWGESAKRVLAKSPDNVLAHLWDRQSGEDGILYDALSEPRSMATLLDTLSQSRHIVARSGTVEGSVNETLATSENPGVRVLLSSESQIQRTVEAAIFEQRQIFKVFRRIEPGVHPELEIGQLLGEQAAAGRVPKLLGSIGYRRDDEDARTLAILQEYEPESITARQLAQDWVGRFAESFLALPVERQLEWSRLDTPSIWEMAESTPPELVKELLATFLDHCQKMGERLAEFHLAIANSGEPAYQPEPSSTFFQRSSYQTVRKVLVQTLETLRERKSKLSAEAQEPSEQLLAKEQELLASIATILHTSLATPRIRCHGSLNLGQVLFTGKDFLLSDWEHVSGKSYAARRIKQPGLADIAGLIYSLQTVSVKAASSAPQLGVHAPQTVAQLRHTLDIWYRWSSSALVKGYQFAAGESELWTANFAERELLLKFYLIERALAELADVLARQPESAALRVGGVLDLLNPDTLTSVP